MGFFDDLTSSFQESVNKTQKESKYKKTISDNKKKIEELLKEEFKSDRAKTQVEGFTNLNLMELTRKHICSHLNG